ncbi:MAG: hypothetical protein H6831_11705 [Planctomycetes bacterium]|nr:hypothetical protein [Planctomycetota bacterium]
MGRILVVVGILIMLVGVLRMNSRALGGPPAHPGDFGSRRTDRQVRTEVHRGLPEFLAFVGTGFCVLLAGAYIGRNREE